MDFLDQYIQRLQKNIIKLSGGGVAGDPIWLTTYMRAYYSLQYYPI